MIETLRKGVVKGETSAALLTNLFQKLIAKLHAYGVKEEFEFTEIENKDFVQSPTRIYTWPFVIQVFLCRRQYPILNSSRECSRNTLTMVRT